MSNHPCRRSDHRLAAEISVPSSEFPNWTILRIRSETDASCRWPCLENRSCVSRINVFEIFWIGSHQLNPVWAWILVCRRRFAESGVLEIVEVNVQVSVNVREVRSHARI